jgi:hypothetical protein
MRWFLTLVAAGCTVTMVNPLQRRAAESSTGTTDTGDPPPASPFADCVGTRDDSLGGRTVYAYDGDGRLATVRYDVDGWPERVWRYTYDVQDGVVDSFTVESDGSATTTWNDAHGHPETALGDGGYEAYWDNTHDGARLTAEVVTFGEMSSSRVVYAYDGCQSWTSSRYDLYGDGSDVTVTTAAWTYWSDCVPERVEVSSPYGGDSATDYDPDGKPRHEELSGATADWAWDCP